MLARSAVVSHKYLLAGWSQFVEARRSRRASLQVAPCFAVDFASVNTPPFHWRHGTEIDAPDLGASRTSPAPAHWALPESFARDLERNGKVASARMSPTTWRRLAGACGDAGD